MSYVHDFRLLPHRISPRLSGQQAAQADSHTCSFAGQHAAQTDSLVCSLTGQQAAQADSLAVATPDNQLPGADSLIHSYTGPMRIITDRLPWHLGASSRPTTTHCPCSLDCRRMDPARQPHRDRWSTPGAVNATRTIQQHTEPISHMDHPFRSPHPLSSAVQRVSILPRTGVMWGHSQFASHVSPFMARFRAQ
jgi:hypothetical protein